MCNASGPSKFSLCKLDMIVSSLRNKDCIKGSIIILAVARSDFSADDKESVAVTDEAIDAFNDGNRGDNFE